MTTMYTPDHEWINIEDHEAATVGITLHAQDALGDVVFVDLPEVGRTFKKGEVTGVVEDAGGGRVIGGEHRPLPPLLFRGPDVADCGSTAGGRRSRRAVRGRRFRTE